MRILVGFKVTPDFESLREADWIAGEGNLADGAGVETRYVPRLLNCFDESALELALRLRDAAAGRSFAEPQLSAVSIGGSQVEPFLTTLLALGYGRVARVDVGVDVDFAPAAVASILAACAHDSDGGDVLLLGCRSGPGDGGTVPFRVAETLGWPCLSQVVEIEALSGDDLRVTCLADDRLLRVTVRPPCVLAVGNAVVSRLRVPTLRDRLARRDVSVDVLRAADLGIDIERLLEREPAGLIRLEAVRRARAGVVVGGETPHEKARHLLDDHLRAVIERL
jgi:electron transfer flavoprotein alpha/beta subunit